MRNAIIGSFVGVMLAAAVLAACGGGGSGGTNATVAQLTTRVEALEAKLAAFSINGGGALVVTGQDVVIDGGNVHVQNGTGTTEGAPNAKGNVIIGYNEDRIDDGNWLTDDTNDHTGSHTLIVGKGNNYSSFGGLVVGERNDVTGQFASVAGGKLNTAAGDYSSVSGGGDRFAVGTMDWAAGSLAEDY